MKNHVTLCQLGIITLATSSGMHDVVVHRSIFLVGILTVIHQGAACASVSICFGQTIRRTDILVKDQFT